MTEVNVHEAKTHLSRLLRRVSQGEEIVIARAGRPVAIIVPYRDRMKERTPGMDRGLFDIPPDFNAPLPDDALQAFER